jgi:hypothetical protein
VHDEHVALAAAAVTVAVAAVTLPPPRAPTRREESTGRVFFEEPNSVYAPPNALVSAIG